MQEKLESLKEKLKDLVESGGDPEICHMIADKALLDFIDDADVTRLFNEVKKYYA